MEYAHGASMGNKPQYHLPIFNHSIPVGDTELPLISKIEREPSNSYSIPAPLPTEIFSSSKMPLRKQ